MYYFKDQHINNICRRDLIYYCLPKIKISRICFVTVNSGKNADLMYYRFSTKRAKCKLCMFGAYSTHAHVPTWKEHNAFFIVLTNNAHALLTLAAKSTFQ